jgi:toxin ParE1/3/4
MIVEWLPAAEDNLETIVSYVAEHDPNAAKRLAERIIVAIGRLAETPLMGRDGRVSGTRELILADTNYIVPYVVEGDAVVILRVLHRSRRWPERF